MTLHVGSFGGGVALQGAAGQRRIDELLLADALDIGPRGGLVAASDVTAYTTLLDRTGLPLVAVHRLISVTSLVAAQVVAIGEGTSEAMGHARVYTGTRFARSSAPDPQPATFSEEIPTDAGPPYVTPFPVLTEGIVVTAAPFPGVFQAREGGAPAIPLNIVLVCLGAREGFAPRTAPGLYAATVSPPQAAIGYTPIVAFDALGTGPYGELNVPGGGLPGTLSKQLFPRGVGSFNNHVFAWGFDDADATNGDGPNRVMFCNLGLPLKWGNDNQDVVGNNRSFTDSDAIILGDAGEIIRAGLKWAGRYWFGTNQQLHYIGGYGRDSFLTDGATPVAKAYNVLGPQALIEGPDRRLYGMSDGGLWVTADGASFEPLFKRLANDLGKSAGYWDLIWTDTSRDPATYPGRTNQDLVWTAVDHERQQLLIGIPWCNASAGSGYGVDTVVLKYHVLTGGFTRQVFTGVQWTATGYFRREGQEPETRLFGTATLGQKTVGRYAYTPNAGASAILPNPLPIASFGPYAPFGPDGRGSVKRLYLTLSWEAADSLPLVFHVTTTVDQAASDDFLLTVSPVAPAGPAVDDLWLDTSLLDANLGNGTAGATTTAFPAALLKQWMATGAWAQLPGLGTNGQRAVVRLPLLPRNGTWLTGTVACTAASGRFELEALGEKPAGGTAAA